MKSNVFEIVSVISQNATPSPGKSFRLKADLAQQFIKYFFEQTKMKIAYFDYIPKYNFIERNFLNQKSVETEREKHRKAGIDAPLVS